MSPSREDVLDRDAYNVTKSVSLDTAAADDAEAKIRVPAAA
ncbi:hypothetical protein ACWGGS_30060 [Streptomyces decoyicus]